MRKYGEDIDKMQQDAVRRMQEMQSRGKAGGMTVQPGASAGKGAR